MDIATFRIQMLDKEIDLIREKINHFDNLRWKRRQMAFVLWTATLGFGIKEETLGYFFLAAFLP